MILQNMTEEELLKEFIEDKENALDIICSKRDKILKLEKKATIYPFVTHSVFTTKRKNTWLMLCIVQKKLKKREDPRCVSIAIADSSWGKFAYTSLLGEDTIVSYSPHLFSRYAERMNVNKTGIELIKHFFLNNRESVFSPFVKTSKTFKGVGQMIMYATSNDGICIGNIQPQKLHYEMRTFISNEMLRGEQIDLYIEDLVIKKELYDEKSVNRR